MKITMVVKTMSDGNICRKCKDTKDYLNRTELMDKIDRVVKAEVNNPESEGMKLKLKYNVERAPFFVVEEDDGNTEIYESVLMLERDYF